MDGHDMINRIKWFTIIMIHTVTGRNIVYAFDAIYIVIGYSVRRIR